MTSNPKTTVPGLGITDFVIIAFKHKWKVLLFTLIGVGAAAYFYVTNPPEYESDAKIYVRYVVDHGAVDSMEGQGQNATIPNRPSDAVLNSEVEIINSWDLFAQVAGEIGPSRLCPMVPNATNDNGARVIAAGLTVTAVPNSDVILISYKSLNPELAPEVLQSLIEAYFNQHLTIHRNKAAFDLVSQQNDIIRGELEKTEADIKAKKAEANIISVQDTANDINTELANTEREIDAQQTTLATEAALVNELERAAGVGSASTDSSSNSKAHSPAGAGPATSGSTQQAAVLASPDQMERYKELLEEIDTLQRKQADLLTIYSDVAIPVQMNKNEIAQLEKQRQDMEKAHPDLLENAEVAGPTSSSHTFDITAERARLIALQAGMKALQSRLELVQQKARDFAKVAPEIEDLERTEQQQQANYDTSQSKLQSATVDEALDPSKIPNIAIAQNPTPAMKVAGKREKTALALAGGGFGAGYGLALLIELVLNQTVRRPMELEQRLGIPLWLSIPFTSNHKRKNKRLPAPTTPGDGSGALVVPNGNAEIAPWEVTHFVRPYAETIRDRLGLYFETNNMTHRPKLLAITGSGGGAGTSTLAAGIASALSETGEGKVLLVDMNPGRTEAHPFFQGRPACSLTAALSNEGKLTSAADNLYLATTSQNNGGTGSFGLKRLRELIPNIKESDFDYVLFDMPPLGQTSPTASMAAYMDNVIFVVEAENAQRDTVKRDYNQLIGRKPDVLVVLNKTRTYAPKWIDKGS